MAGLLTCPPPPQHPLLQRWFLAIREISGCPICWTHWTVSFWYPSASAHQDETEENLLGCWHLHFAFSLCRQRMWLVFRSNDDELYREGGLFLYFLDKGWDGRRHGTHPH